MVAKEEEQRARRQRLDVAERDLSDLLGDRFEALVVADAARESSGRSAGTWCARVGMAIFGGVMVEPVTWGRRAYSPLIASTVIANLVTGAVLIRAGRRAES